MATHHSNDQLNVWYTIAAITLLAAALDLFRLTAQPIWLDETVSIAMARLNVHEFLATVTTAEPFMFLYYVVLRIPLGLSQNPFAARILSAICAAGAVPSLYLLGRRLFDDRTAMLAALLLAVNSLFIEYAQEARSYTMAALIALWSWYMFLDLIEKPGWRRTLSYSLVSGALAYCQVFSLLMLPAQWAALSILRPRGKVLKFVAASAAIVGILVLPMVLMLSRVKAQQNWIERPNLVVLHELSTRFVNLPLNVGPLPHPMLLVSMITLAIVALPFVGAVSGLREKNGDKLFGYACAAFGASFPLAGLLSVSFLVRAVYVMRYVVPSLPFFLLLLAAGLSELRPSLLKVGLILLLIANVFGTVEYYRVPSKPDWPKALEYLVSRVRPEDKLALIPWHTSGPFEYNLSRLRYSIPPSTIVFPRRSGVLHNPGSAEREAALAPTYSRLWIVIEDPGPRDNELLAELDKRYTHSWHTDFRRISVILYANGSDSASLSTSPRKTIGSQLPGIRGATLPALLSFRE